MSCSKESKKTVKFFYSVCSPFVISTYADT